MVGWGDGTVGKPKMASPSIFQVLRGLGPQAPGFMSCRIMDFGAWGFAVNSKAIGVPKP